ncbi:hypothetical protein E0485_08080 [Paenibacillus albiflavus]|uniref:DUF4097 domain-containing protein n=1 Tax=Paenibacillus albiflavus TaxID=2545760 RepID=A0A4R4EH06_9BACL|nr:DUF4097 family beta strand repeat-containing protein [Paenibacillus albiflavus]TCZ78450.1 hypothetical protein E0485_08080 [Paenibacillus albiflavus]
MAKKHTIISALLLTTTIIFTGCSSESTSTRNTSTGNWEDALAGVEWTTKFKQIKVDTEVFAVRVERSADKSTHFKVNDAELGQLQKNFELRIDENNDALSVKATGKKKTSFGFNDLNTAWRAELLIQLPAQEYEKVNVTSNVGKITFDQIQTNTLDITNDAGQIEIQDTDTKQTTIHNAAGLITLNNVTGKLDINNSTGAVNLDLKTIQDNINVDTSVGAVKLTMDNEPDKIKLDLSTDIGRVKTNLDLNFDKQSNSTVRGSKGSNGPEVKISTNVGEIQVNHR